MKKPTLEEIKELVTFVRNPEGVLEVFNIKGNVKGIRQVIQDGMLNAYKVSDEVKEDIIDFVDINKNRLRELSLRTVLKVADLAVAFPDNWESYAENTVMRRA